MRIRYFIGQARAARLGGLGWQYSEVGLQQLRYWKHEGEFNHRTAPHRITMMTAAMNLAGTVATVCNDSLLEFLVPPRL